MAENHSTKESENPCVARILGTEDKAIKQITQHNFIVSKLGLDKLVPKGSLIVECGKLLKDVGKYRIKVFNTINFSKSMRYNPFAYIHSETDILKLVNTIIVNTKGEGDKSGEDFWVKSERLLYCALIGYIDSEMPESEKNFATLLKMINMSETREEDDTFKNDVDLLFEKLEKEKPDCFAVRQYLKFKLAAGVI